MYNNGTASLLQDREDALPRGITATWRRRNTDDDDDDDDDGADDDDDDDDDGADDADNGADEIPTCRESREGYSSYVLHFPPSLLTLLMPLRMPFLILFQS